MSDSNSDHEDTDCDQQLEFVKILENFKILFDKRMTPAIKAQKEKALGSITVTFNLKTKQNLDFKKVLKKFNNMKTKVKKVSDVNRTGNKKIDMLPWQQKFYDLWNAQENPVLQKVPGAATAGVARNENLEIVDPVPKKRRMSNIDSNQHGVNSETLQELQRRCLLQQIETAVAQKNAAIAQEQAARAIEQSVEAWFRVNLTDS